MTQYIDKSALVAEIKRQMTIYNDDKNIHHVAKYNILVDILSFIDTLEVKEVDLNKEIKKAQRKYKTIEEYEGYPATIYSNDIECIAKNFFKLGIKVAQKGE